MQIDRGKRLGPYEVLSALGAGGMGEVWRARDTRLEREVAIKVLPASFAGNAQLRLRFEREAKTISSLNHPHICTLHDVGHEDGVDYLVMELIDGESLADRLKKGPLPVDQVLRLGAQIALALDAAHRHGIVHRDLKPGNVMLTRSGAKLLDFGLAKAGDITLSSSSFAEGATAAHLHGATEAKPLTQEGTIVGTFQYMAPEQLEGVEADARTDIFALGCVLYEMATGRRAFDGASRTSLIAAIVSSQPAPISSVAPMTPPALDHVVKRCLEKSADDRWQSAHDVASELQWISEAGSSAGVAAPVARRKRRLEWIGWAAALALALAWGAFTLLRKQPVQPRVETAIVAPEGVFLDGDGGGIALSVDGRRLAFVAHRSGEQPLIWVRDLGSSAVRPLPGTAGAALPFWSPDGKAVAFFAGGKLLRVGIDGGSPEPIASAPDPYGGSWAPDGTILFASEDSILHVSAAGGPATKVIETPLGFPRYPVILPDGRRFLYTPIGRGSEDAAVYVGSLDGDAPKLVLAGVYSSTAYVSPGWILYVRDGALRAQRVDPETLVPSGEAVRLADRVQYIPDDQLGFFAASSTGSLAFVAGEEAGKTELVWVSREGKELQAVTPAAMYYSPRLSRDGKRVAVDLSDLTTATGDIWIHDLQRGSSTRLTHDPANESSPIWPPDDRSVTFYSEKKGQDLYQRSAAGIGTDAVVLEDKAAKRPLDISPDGRWLAYAVATTDVWLLDRQNGKATPFLASPFMENALQFSPDGKWIAYVSDESGQQEVYVVQFPEPSGKWVVSRGGGNQPEWSADGRQIYYLSTEQKLMSVPVTTGESFDAGMPVPLFHAPVRMGYTMRQYCAAADGSRFLLNRRVDADSARPITFVQNWAAALDR